MPAAFHLHPYPPCIPRSPIPTSSSARAPCRAPPMPRTAPPREAAHVRYRVRMTPSLPPSRMCDYSISAFTPAGRPPPHPCPLPLPPPEAQYCRALPTLAPTRPHPYTPVPTSHVQPPSPPAPGTAPPCPCPRLPLPPVSSRFPCGPTCAWYCPALPLPPSAPAPGFLAFSVWPYLRLVLPRLAPAPVCPCPRFPRVFRVAPPAPRTAPPCPVPSWTPGS